MLARGMVRRRAKRGGLYIALFFVLAALPLLCVFPYIAATNNPNENVRTYMTMAIVERGTLQLDDYVTRYGYVNDMAQYPKSGPAHFYSVKAPAVSFAAVPVYWSFLKIAPRIGIEVPDDKTATPTRRVDWFRSTTWALRIVVVQ